MNRPIETPGRGSHRTAASFSRGYEADLESLWWSEIETERGTTAAIDTDGVIFDEVDIDSDLSRYRGERHGPVERPVTTSRPFVPIVSRLPPVKVDRSVKPTVRAAPPRSIASLCSPADTFAEAPRRRLSSVYMLDHADSRLSGGRSGDGLRQ